MAEIISGVISSLLTSFGFYLFRRLEMKESSTSNVTTNGIGRKSIFIGKRLEFSNFTIFLKILLDLRKNTRETMTGRFINITKIKLTLQKAIFK